ncbi:MAG: O-antigen ligase family protein [Desulfobulbaceae bacterium]|nr:O-antigen ligase family protein [Desulfobulbaceae bacterium]
MFITEGRAGQVVFFVLLGLFFIQFFRKKILKGILFSCLIVPLSIVFAFYFSPTFENRTRMAYDEIKHFKNNPNTSLGMRIHFVKNSWEVFLQNPLIGVGTGCFKEKYTIVNTKNSPTLEPTDNPHNQYILVLSRFGIMGFTIFLGIFIVQMRQAFIVQDDLSRIRFAFPLFFLTIMFAESYLAVYETSFLFSVFSSILYNSDTAFTKRYSF